MASRAVSISTGVSLLCLRTAAVRALPSMQGIMTSVMTRSNCSWQNMSQAARPSSALATVYPALRRVFSTT